MDVANIRKVSWIAAGLAAAALCVLSAATCTDYSGRLDGQRKGGLNERNAINTTIRNARWELRGDYTVPDDVLAGYTLTLCPTPGCSAMVPGETIRVWHGGDYYPRLKHEILHAVLYEVGYEGDHHDWMGTHGWCYGASDCTDAWNPNRETGHPMSGENPLESDDE